MNCSFQQHPIPNKPLLRYAVSGFAASFLLLAHTNQVLSLFFSSYKSLLFFYSLPWVINISRWFLFSVDGFVHSPYHRFQVLAAHLSPFHELFTLANVADTATTLPVDASSEDGNAMLMMMRGMTANNFDPVRYSGRWFEVASLKRGFAGQGQEDCHCTQVNAYIFEITSFMLGHKFVM